MKQGERKGAKASACPNRKGGLLVGGKGRRLVRGLIVAEEKEEFFETVQCFLRRP